MNEVKKDRSNLFFIVFFLIVLMAYLMASLLAYKAFVPKASQVKETISQVDIVENELTLSTFKLTREEPIFYLDKERDKSGETYYISRSYPSLVNMGLLVLISISTLGVILHVVFAAYRDHIREKSLGPVVKLSRIITDILSGTSSEGDLDKVIADLRPIIGNEKTDSINLEKSIESLFEAEKNRRAFTANVSHELKTPLTSINGYAEMIASGLTGKEDTKEFAGIILQEGNKLLQMIEEIIKLSKYESHDKSNMNIQRIDLGQEAKEVIDSMAHYAKSKEVDLTYDLEQVIISADKSMIQEMIRNLVSNAIKYNKNPGYVHLSLSNDYPFAKLRVKDGGIGISPEDQEKVFERFYMANRNNPKYSGTGLGLSIVKHIVESHDGIIDLESSLGQGSTFTVKLPMIDKKRLAYLN